LNSESELIILDASGMTPFRLLRPFFYFAIICGVTTAVLSLFLVPTSRAQMEFRTEEIAKDMVNRLITDGSFLHPADDITIFVSSVNSLGELEDIFIHDKRSEERDLTYIATKAVLVRENEGSHLVLFNGLIQMLDIQSQTLSHVGFESFAYELTNLPTTKSRELKNVNTYGIITLLRADESLLKILKKTKALVHFEAHDRIIKPLQCIFFVLLASVIMLIGGHSRFGLAKQIFFSIGAILFFNILITNGLTLVRKDSSNWFLPYLCLILGVIILNFLIFRTRQPFRLRKPVTATPGRDL
jgi:lipopolysaccharide export system permease protein